MQTDCRISPWFSLTEVFIFFGLAELIIWGSGQFRPPVLLVAVIMIGICVGSNYFHGDSLEKIGLARKNFWPTMKAVWFLILPVIPLIIIGWGKETPEGWTFWFSILGYPFWGFAQEYAIMGFVANRLSDAIKPVWLISLINGTLLGIAHLPNPVLTGVTFVSGTLFTFLFFRRRHLVPYALLHAAYGVGLSFAFSDINGFMSVGPAYLSRISVPF